MTNINTSNIRVVGTNGAVLHVHGEDAGAEGFYLGKDQVKGIFDAPIKTVERSPARMDGGQLRKVKQEIREFSLGFHVMDPDGDYIDAASALSEAFVSAPDEYDDTFLPPRIEWETDRSGTRWLEFFLSEGEEFEPDVDPIGQNYGNLIAHCKAYMPFWQSPPDISTWKKTGSGSGSGTVTVWNPTPLPCYQQWVVTAGAWTLPDVSWRGAPTKRAPGGAYPTRSLALPPDLGGGRVNLDPANLFLRDSSDTNAIARMPVPGQFFLHVIPPWTPPTQLPVSVTNAPSGGATVSLIMPRRWRKPWGGER